MIQEEKAKRYDKALERAKSFFKRWENVEAANSSLVLEEVKDIFPELQESEDERIRKRLIAMCQDYIECYALDQYNLDGYKEALAWLEKQGCQKSVDKEYTFKSIPRLLDMIEPTNRVKFYCRKLIESLQTEGYATDAKIVGDCLKQMNGEKVAMATMDEQKPDWTEEDRIRKELIDAIQGLWDNDALPLPLSVKRKDAWLAWLEKQGEPVDKGEISDGFHTFSELYYYRMLYNAAFFNMLPKELVHKSKKHNDGEECFGGGWFIVMANLPTGQISNHYELKDWELFQIPEKERADKWDGHTPQEAAERLHKFLLEKQGEPKSDVWTEQDKTILEGIICEIEANKNNAPSYDLPTYDKFLNWLESLKKKIKN